VPLRKSFPRSMFRSASQERAQDHACNSPSPAYFVQITRRVSPTVRPSALGPRRRAIPLPSTFFFLDDGRWCPVTDREQRGKKKPRCSFLSHFCRCERSRRRRATRYHSPPRHLSEEGMVLVVMAIQAVPSFPPPQRRRVWAGRILFFLLLLSMRAEEGKANRGLGPPKK